MSMRKTMRALYTRYLDQLSASTVIRFKSDLKEYAKGYDFRTFTLDLKDNRQGKFSRAATEASPFDGLETIVWERKSKLGSELQESVEASRMESAERIVQARVVRGLLLKETRRLI